MRSSPVAPSFLCAPPLRVAATAFHHQQHGSSAAPPPRIHALPRVVARWEGRRGPACQRREGVAPTASSANHCGRICRSCGLLCRRTRRPTTPSSPLFPLMDGSTGHHHPLADPRDCGRNRNHQPPGLDPAAPSNSPFYCRATIHRRPPPSTISRHDFASTYIPPVPIGGRCEAPCADCIRRAAQPTGECSSVTTVLPSTIAHGQCSSTTPRSCSSFGYEIYV